MHRSATLADGRTVTAQLVEDELAAAAEALATELAGTPAAAHLDRAVDIFQQVALGDEFVEFLTLPAYDLLD